VRHAYIYYRIDRGQAALAADRVDALLASLAPHCSHAPRRLQRCDDPATWMEVYEGIADFAAFAAALKEVVREAGCDAFTLGERTLECFAAPATPVPDI
jgi:hypothetical protein